MSKATLITAALSKAWVLPTSFCLHRSSRVAGVLRVSPLVEVYFPLLFYLELGGLLQAHISELLYFILTGEF